MDGTAATNTLADEFQVSNVHAGAGTVNVCCELDGPRQLASPFVHGGAAG
jgi:hypothetical protein